MTMIPQLYDEYRHAYSKTAMAHIKSHAGLHPAARVLDLACGTGLVLREFLDTHAVFGLDLSADMLAQARQRYGQRQNVQLVLGNGEALPFPAQSFDLVTIGQAIHWFRLQKLVPELQRVLRPDAWIAVISKYPSPQEPYRLLHEYSLDKVRPGAQPPGCSLTGISGVGNLLGLERAGFSNYERTVFEFTVEYSVEVYLKGCAASVEAQALGSDERRLYLDEMERGLSQLAKEGIFRESLLEYVLMARNAPKQVVK